MLLLVIVSRYCSECSCSPSCCCCCCQSLSLSSHLYLPRFLLHDVVSASFTSSASSFRRVIRRGWTPASFRVESSTRENEAIVLSQPSPSNSHSSPPSIACIHGPPISWPLSASKFHILHFLKERLMKTHNRLMTTNTVSLSVRRLGVLRTCTVYVPTRGCDFPRTGPRFKNGKIGAKIHMTS